jgi:hypothetical protein
MDNSRVLRMTFATVYRRLLRHAKDALFTVQQRLVVIKRIARYVDTFKSAAWFDCSIDRTKDVNVCRAWDTNGNLIAFGNYRLDGEGRAATAPELRPSQVHLYLGHPNLAWIYLFGDHREIVGKPLVPVNDAGKPLERFEVRIGNDR